MRKNIYIFVFVVLGLFSTAKAQMLTTTNYGMRGYMYGGTNPNFIQSDTSIIRVMPFGNKKGDEFRDEQFFEYSRTSEEGALKRIVAWYHTENSGSPFYEDLQLFNIDYDITDMEVLGDDVYFCGNDLNGLPVFGKFNSNTMTQYPYNIKVWTWPLPNNTGRVLPKKMAMYEKEGYIHLIAVGDHTWFPPDVTPSGKYNSFIVDLILSNDDIVSTHIVCNTTPTPSGNSLSIVSNTDYRFEDVTACQDYVVIMGHRNESSKPAINVTCYPKTANITILEGNDAAYTYDIHNRRKITSIVPMITTWRLSGGYTLNRFYSVNGKYSDRVVVAHAKENSFCFSAGACCAYEYNNNGLTYPVSYGVSLDLVQINNPNSLVLKKDMLIETYKTYSLHDSSYFENEEDFNHLPLSTPKDLRISGATAYLLFNYDGNNKDDGRMYKPDVLYDIDYNGTSYNRKYMGSLEFDGGSWVNKHQLSSMGMIDSSAIYLSGSDSKPSNNSYKELIWWKTVAPSIAGENNDCGTIGEVHDIHSNHRGKQALLNEMMDVYIMGIDANLQIKRITRWDHSIDYICGDIYNPEQKDGDNGKSSHSQLSDYLKIYPNPADEVINIQSDKEISRVIILDQNEQEVMMKDVQGFGTTLNVSGVKPGIYFVKIITNEGCEIHRVSIK